MIVPGATLVSARPSRPGSLAVELAHPATSAMLISARIRYSTLMAMS
jgi:hypothetical protein